MSSPIGFSVSVHSDSALAVFFFFLFIHHRSDAFVLFHFSFLFDLFSVFVLLLIFVFSVKHNAGCIYQLRFLPM